MVASLQPSAAINKSAMESQTFGEKIKALRLDLNYSLKYVGDKIGYNPSLLSKIERNKKKAPERLIKDLSKVYKFPLKELVAKYLSEEIYYRIRNYEQAEEVLNIVKSRLKKEGKGTQIEKNRDAIIESIKKYFSDKPVEKAWVFGSFARNTFVSMDSDIDIMIEFKKPNKVSLFDIIRMKEELSNQTGRAIDLVEKGQELKSFKETIQKEKFLVYGG